MLHTIREFNSYVQLIWGINAKDRYSWVRRMMSLVNLRGSLVHMLVMQIIVPHGLLMRCLMMEGLLCADYFCLWDQPNIVVWFYAGINHSNRMNQIITVPWSFVLAYISNLAYFIVSSVWLCCDLENDFLCKIFSTKMGKLTSLLLCFNQPLGIVVSIYAII